MILVEVGIKKSGTLNAPDLYRTDSCNLVVM